jgi:serine/threonine protein kinase
MTSRNFRNALQPGHTVHWYRIDSVLGQGGFGITYLAHDTNLDHPVAIKEFLPMEMAMRDADQSVQPASQEHDERFRWGLDRFLSEARTLARFRHASIVRVASVFEANNTAYMVMELERGETLHALLARERTLVEDRLRPMLLSLLEGLEVVHGAGFIHRDIKPANVIVRADGTPVLIDFGSARQAIGQQTRTLTTLISPGYAPYEQYLSGGDRQGPWTDIYSLAATMYRCVVGKPPIDALDRSEGLLKSQRDLYMPAIELGQGNYSDSFLRAIDHGMRFRAADRPQSIAEWRRELNGETVSEVLDTTTRIDFPIASDEHRPRQTSIPVSTTLKSSTSGEPATPPSPKPTATRSVPLIIVAIGAVAIGAWLWQRGTSEPDRPATQAGQATGSTAPEMAATPVPPTTVPSPAEAPPSPAAEKLAAARSAAEQAGDDPTRLASSAGQFKEVLALAPDDAEARAELSAISTTLAKQAMDALSDNDLDKAERAVTAAESIDASAPLVATARRQLDTVRAAASVETMPSPPPPASPPAPADAPTSAVAVESPTASGPATPAEPGRDQEVAELLRLANADLKANRLTAPRDRNAADRFGQVLRLDPGNRDAIAGIDRVADRLADLATSSLARAAYERAGDYVSRGRSLRPGQQRWSTMQTAIEDARERTAAAERAAPPAPTAAPERTAPPPTVAAAPSTAAAPPAPAAAPPPALPSPPPPPKVSLRVVGIDGDLQRFGLSESDLRSAIGSRLKAAGYESGDGGLSLKVELKYNRNTTTGIYSYATFVTASGNGASGRNVQWSADDSGITQERDLLKLKAVLLKEVDEFIAANPAR